MTPILVLGFGINPSIAVGTDLIYAAITKSSGVYFHQKNRTIDWKIVFLLAAGSIPCSILTVQFLHLFREQGINYDRIILLTLSCMLIITSVIVLSKNKLLAFIHNRHTGSKIIKIIRQLRAHITFIAGCALGALVTISSVGAGAIGSAILFLLYPKKKSICIVGTDLAHAVPLTAIAGFGHFQFGTIDFSLLSGLLLGGIPSIYLGSVIGKHLPDHLLRPFIAIILLVMGIKLAL